jgi:hypothetical protein
MDNPLLQLTAFQGKACAQGLVAIYYFLETFLKSFNVEGSIKPKTDVHVVSRG